VAKNRNPVTARLEAEEVRVWWIGTKALGD
jgi:hypothetical protein